MPQQDYGAMTGVAKLVDKYINKPVSGTLNLINKLPDSLPGVSKSKQDTSWHDNAVSEANESYRKHSASEAAAKKQGLSHSAAQAEHKKVATRK